jgi:hypothetical protein
LGCLSISLIFCLGVVIILVFPLLHLLAVDEGPLAVGLGGVHFCQGKGQFVIFDQLLFSGDDLGPDRGLFGSALGQVEASAWSSVPFPQLPFPSRRQVVVLTGSLLPFTMQLFFPEVRRDPFRCLSSCVNAMISPSAGGGSALTL